jgi:hypothetical protein
VAALSKKYADFAAWAKRQDRDHSHAQCPVQGAPERERIIHFQYGSLVIYNVWDQTEEMDGTYRVIDAHVRGHRPRGPRRRRSSRSIFTATE